jgi:hypothetical protein
MMTRRWWTIGFLGVTLLALVMEIVAAFDNSSNTLPWTYLITHFVPQWLFWPTLTVLVAWIVYHFTHEKWVSNLAYREGYRTGRGDESRRIPWPQPRRDAGEIERDQIRFACEMLGFDPASVSSIHVTPYVLTVRTIERTEGNEHQGREMYRVV